MAFSLSLSLSLSFSLSFSLSLSLTCRETRLSPTSERASERAKAPTWASFGLLRKKRERRRFWRVRSHTRTHARTHACTIAMGHKPQSSSPFFLSLSALEITPLGREIRYCAGVGTSGLAFARLSDEVVIILALCLDYRSRSGAKEAGKKKASSLDTSPVHNSLFLRPALKQGLASSSRASSLSLCIFTLCCLNCRKVPRKCASPEE